jgi:hypothetical protein
MSFMKIVTHSGTAHADEIMAIALLAHHHDVKIEEWDLEIVRVNNCDPETERDRAYDTFRKCRGLDPCELFNFYVVDIGKVHDKDKGFFDHHQFAADAPPACSFSLIAGHLGYTHKDFPWMRKMEFIDSKGPFAWFKEKMGRHPANHQEIRDVMGDGDSVFEYFPRVSNVVPDSMFMYYRAVSMAHAWLGLELDWLQKKTKNVEYARKNMRVVDLGSFKMVYFDQKETKGTLEICDELAAQDPTIIMTGKLDERGDGFSAMRLADNPRVDFAPREFDGDCVFAHKNGFVLKWKANWDGYLDALKRSVKD